MVDPLPDPEPHEYESEGGATIPAGPCAVCGQHKGAYVHAPLPLFSRLMGEMGL